MENENAPANGISQGYHKKPWVQLKHPKIINQNKIFASCTRLDWKKKKKGCFIQMSMQHSAFENNKDEGGRE